MESHGASFSMDLPRRVSQGGAAARRVIMAKLTAEDYHAEELEDDLVARGFPHLRVRRRADILTIESGPKGKGAIGHARLRRETVHLWRLEVVHGAGWETTPIRGIMVHIVGLLVAQFSWLLSARFSVESDTPQPTKKSDR